MKKRVYETPALAEVGSFATLTRGNENGSFTDALFPSDTPKEDLTFSDLD